MHGMGRVKSLCIPFKISAKKIAEKTQLQVILAVTNIVSQKSKIQTNK